MCPNKTGLNLCMQGSEQFASAGKCRDLQGRKAALGEIFTVTWLDGVGHLDLLEPNKWRVYLCLWNCVPCMSVICRLAECCCWCSLYHYTEIVNFTILETLSSSGTSQAGTDSEMNDPRFCLFVFFCWELLLSVALLLHRHCLPTVLLRALSFRTGYKVKLVCDFN